MTRWSRNVRYFAFLTWMVFTHADIGHGRASDDEPRYKISTFRLDATIPLGHRCMGVLPTKSKRILDPLYVNGFVLTTDGLPVVFCAVDWCEIRNGAYDQWREALAAAAGTDRQRVFLCSLHQHDAPVVDRDAAQLLDEVGLAGELYDRTFHNQVVRNAAAAVKQSLVSARAVTHVGLGQARVTDIASSRRVVAEDGRVTFHRGSRSGSDPFHREAPEGEIDPWLKTISFWEDDKPLVALHAYATHPMSYYGAGEVSSDFVGLARDRRQRDNQSIHQIYASGCSGDVTAGKYNDGSPANRAELTRRLYEGIVAAWNNSNVVPLSQVRFRNAEFQLPFSSAPPLTRDNLRAVLDDTSQSAEVRILAAMGLASRLRFDRGTSIDMPCVDLGVARIVLFPGESFVGYQLMAQRMAPNTFVLAVGYGECWPGYIPTRDAFKEGFTDKWLWVDRGSEEVMVRAMQSVLTE